MIELRVCVEGACSNKGAYGVFRALSRAIEAAGLEDEVELVASGCLKDCNRGGVCTAIGEERFSLYAETAAEFVQKTLAPRCAQNRD